MVYSKQGEDFFQDLQETVTVDNVNADEPFSTFSFYESTAFRNWRCLSPSPRDWGWGGATAHAIGEEKQKENCFESNVRSTFPSVTDPSVLTNDLKQKLAKERREGKKKIQDVNKEMQLHEKERKARTLYEKQMEEKQRKLKEQKEKDEQRRASVRIKRRQKLEEERERYKAAVLLTLQRSNRAQYRQKAWLWEGCSTLKSESRFATKHSISDEELEQGNVDSNRCMFTTSTGVQNPLTKKKTEKKRTLSFTTKDVKLHSCPEPEPPPKEEKLCVRYLYGSSQENALVSHLLVPTEASLARSETATSLSIPGKDFSGVDLLQHIRMALRSQSNNELKTTVMAPELKVAMPLQAKIEISPKEKVEMPPKADVEAPPKDAVEGSPEIIEASPMANMETLPEVSVEASPEAGVEASRKTIVETLPKAGVKAPPKACVEAPPRAGVETASGDGMKMPTKVCVVTSSEASGEGSPKAKVRDFLQKSDINKQASNPVTKKCPSSDIPRYRWPSSASGLRLPSTVSRQIQKNHPPLPSPVVSKQSTTSSVSYKVIPIQRTPYAPNALISTTKKKKDAISKTVNRSEARSHKNMANEEPSVKSTPGAMNAEEATKILAEKRRLAREQKEKEDEEERARKQMEESVIRKMKALTKKAIKGLGGDFLTLEDDQGDGQNQKDVKTKKGCHDQEDQGVQLQALETSGNIVVEEGEADDEEEMDESPVVFSDIGTSHKLKKKMKPVKKMPLTLTYLASGGEHINKETKSLNSDVKISKKNAKDPLTQAKGSRLSVKKMAGHPTKTTNSRGVEHSVSVSKSLTGRPHGLMCGDKIIDLVGQVEPPLLSSDAAPLDNQKGNVKDTVKFHQNPEMCFEDEKE
ncbi:MAP7 domain-containing protein 3 [Trichechus inunguis]